MPYLQVVNRIKVFHLTFLSRCYHLGSVRGDSLPKQKQLLV